MRLPLLALFICGNLFLVNAQSNQWLVSPPTTLNDDYFVYFKTKETTGTPSLSVKALQRRQKNCIQVDEKDWRVSNRFLKKVTSLGANVQMHSRWLNGAYISCSQAVAKEISSLPSVKKIIPQKRIVSQTCGGKVPCFNFSLPQTDLLDARQLHQNGFTGEGVLICVMDDGFDNLQNVSAFTKLFNEKRILARKNFLTNDSDVFWVGGHGTAVLSNICGFVEGQIVGTGIGASFLLARTEIDSVETPLEMYLWVAAAEWADSIGADIFSTSLGYSQFDDPQYDYYYADMDGGTTPISKAAQIAADKGILVVNSAGNSGNGNWRYITAPADATGVLTVGAVGGNRELATFSSRGPTWDGRIKPDICALGASNLTMGPGGYLYYTNGTSFSCPLISGLAACLMQAAPWATAAELFETLKRSGDHANKPDNDYGYGTPSGSKTYQLLTGKTLPAVPDCGNLNPDGFGLFPNPSNGLFNLAINCPNGSLGYTYLVHDMSGRILLNVGTSSFSGIRQWTIDIRDIATGIYYLQVQDSDGYTVFEHKVAVVE